MFKYILVFIAAIVCLITLGALTFLAIVPIAFFILLANKFKNNG